MKISLFSLKSVLKRWISLGFSITVIFLFGFLATQQIYRMSANDTPAEIAHNVDLSLGEGTPYKYFSSARPVEIGLSLTPFVLLYDLDGKPLAGNGALDGNYPVPPKGIFEGLRKDKESRFTWEPKPKARQAVVALFHEGNNPAFIIVGRSLTETEQHIKQLFLMTGLLYLITLFGSLVLTFILS